MQTASISHHNTFQQTRGITHSLRQLMYCRARGLWAVSTRSLCIHPSWAVAMCCLSCRLGSWGFGVRRRCRAAAALQASSSCRLAFWGCGALGPLQASRLLSCFMPHRGQAALAPQLHTQVIMSCEFVWPTAGQQA